MSDEPDEALDLEALMEGIRRRVAEKKARGLYSVDALAGDRADASEPWDQERIEEVQALAAVTQRMVVPPSDKPGIGPLVTRAKSAVVRAGFYNLEDVLGQVTRFNAEMAAYAASLGTEVVRLRGEVDELRAAQGPGDVASRLTALEAAALDARLRRLEAGVADPLPASAGTPGTAGAAAAAPPAPAAEVEDLRLEAALGMTPDADLFALLGARDRVLALRCGDGALLDAAEATEATGVDDRRGLVAAGLRAGRRLVHADPVAHLEALAAGAIDGVVAAGLLEELTPDRLVRLVRGLARAVAPGGAVAIEVRNPRNPVEMSTRFWRDPRRLRPVDPETVGILLRVAGFADVELLWAPAGHTRAGDLPAAGSPSCAVLAHR